MKGALIYENSEEAISAEPFVGNLDPQWRDLADGSLRGAKRQRRLRDFGSGEHFRARGVVLVEGQRSRATRRRRINENLKKIGNKIAKMHYFHQVYKDFLKLR